MKPWTLRIVAGLPPLAAAVAAAAGRLQIHPDQWREWLGAAEGFGATVGSSAFGAVSPVYKLFLPTALAGGDPQGWWGVPWLLLLAICSIALAGRPRALVVWTAAWALPPAAYWLDNHAITASISFGASALALALVAAGNPVRALWAGALALAVYPVGGAIALAVGVVALATAESNRNRLRVALHGLAASGMAALPHLLAARDPSLSRGGGGPLGSSLDAALFLTFGAVPAVALAALIVVAWLLVAKARVALAVAALQWLFAAALLPLKTDWWAGYYAVTTSGLLAAALAVALPRPERMSMVAAAIGVVMVVGLSAREPATMRPDAFWQGKRPDEPWHVNLEQTWAVFNADLVAATDRRPEGDGHAFLRWAREHRDGVVDERRDLRISTTVSSPRCPGADRKNRCMFEAQLVDELPSVAHWLVFRSSSIGAPAGPLATLRWTACDSGDAMTETTVLPTIWVHQTTLSIGAGYVTAPGGRCRPTPVPTGGDLLLVAADHAAAPSAAKAFQGEPPYAARRF